MFPLFIERGRLESQDSEIDFVFVYVPFRHRPQEDFELQEKVSIT